MTESVAFAFLNTVASPAHGAPDSLRRPTDARSWVLEHFPESATPTSTWSTADARRLRDEALALRRCILALFAAHTTGAVPTEHDLHGFNRALGAGRWTERLRLIDGGLRVERTLAEPVAAGFLAAVAASAARVMTDTPAGRLRCCAGEGCGRWFADTSKSGRRRWCSMARCGNRAKVRRHREKRADS